MTEEQTKVFTKQNAGIGHEDHDILVLNNILYSYDGGYLFSQSKTTSTLYIAYLNQTSTSNLIYLTCEIR